MTGKAQPTNPMASSGDGSAWITTCCPLVVLSEKAEGAQESRAEAGQPLRVLGVVYEPGVVDAQGDWADEEVIAEAAHAFLANGGRLRRMHREDIRKSEAVLAESFIAPADVQFNGLTVRKGAWVVVVRIVGDRLRDEILSGQLTGFSMGGYGWREPAPPPDAPQLAPPSAGKNAPTYRITRFIPVELSLVDHPANQRAFVALKSDASDGAERVNAVLRPVTDLQAGWLTKSTTSTMSTTEDNLTRRDSQ
jgi:hypothetical protein